MWVNALSVKQVHTLRDFHTSSPLAYFLKSKKHFCCCYFVCLNQPLLSVLETSKLGKRWRRGGSVLLLTHILHKTWQRTGGYFTLHIHDSQASPLPAGLQEQKESQRKVETLLLLAFNLGLSIASPSSEQTGLYNSRAHTCLWDVEDILSIWQNCQLPCCLWYKSTLFYLKSGRFYHHQWTRKSH